MPAKGRLGPRLRIDSSGITSRAAIIAALREIGARLRLAGDNPFRARAYETGADAVEALADAELERRVRSATLTEVAGIGGALAVVISELAATGRSAVLNRLREATPAALLELTSLSGVSRERALRLHEALGVDNLDDLAAAARTGRVRAVKGFGPKSEAALLKAIDAYRKRPQSIRLVDARDATADLADFVAAQPGVAAVDAVGGVRLWEEVIDEIAVVAVVDRADDSTMDSLAAYPPLARVEERAPERIVGRLASGIRVRVRVTVPMRRGLALIEETGPPAHLDMLRMRAHERGLQWDTLVAPDEAALFAALDLPVVPPEARTWSSLPRPGDLRDLIATAHLRGLVHCHTNASDGRHTLAEMARAADARGASYMTVTDHSPTASYAGGLDVDRLRRQWDEIDHVQETVKVRLLRGTESDILADGALDYPDAVLEKLDVIIASIHGRHRMDATAMTARLVRAMQLPVFKIWGHPLGRLVLRREPIACDMDAVLDAVAMSRAAIEISGDPYRLDLPSAWIPAARRRGIRFVISTDAHAIADFDNVEYGVALARRGGVRRGEVLNALPEEAFRTAVRPLS
jgi:DNA polymerase (family 10)